MRKSSKIKGLRIVGQDGADLGAVKRLLFDENNEHLVALVVSDRNLFGLMDATAVPFSAATAMGNDAIIVESNTSLVSVRSDATISRLYDNAEPATGIALYTSSGRSLGTLSDTFVDEASGRVVGYELSGGILADVTGGRRFINVRTEVRYGDSLALVSPSVADELESQDEQQQGGLKGVYASAKDRVATTYDSLATASVEQQKAFCVGKVASRDVVVPSDSATMATPSTTPQGQLTGPSDITTPPVTETGLVVAPSASDVDSSGQPVSGEVLVRSGDTITQQQADRAATSGVLSQLLLAAGSGAISGAASGVASSASGAASSASDYASGTGANLQDSASQSAIGKVAGREVDTDEGSTIVAPGQIITQAIMEHARTAGKENEIIAAAGLGSVKQGAATVSEKASGLFDTLKEKVGDLVGASREKLDERQAQREEQQIQDAIGRPVTRVILTPDDEVILNTGDMITNKAIEHAKATGVLELILDSVSTVEADITPGMLRARDEGQDALPTQVRPTNDAAPENNPPLQSS